MTAQFGIKTATNFPSLSLSLVGSNYFMMLPSNEVCNKCVAVCLMDSEDSLSSSANLADTLWFCSLDRGALFLAVLSS